MQTSLPASWSREAIHGEVEERRREEVVRGASLHCRVRSPGSKESRRALRVGAREGGYKGVPALEGSNSIQLVGGISPAQRTYPEHSSEPSIL